MMDWIEASWNWKTPFFQAVVSSTLALAIRSYALNLIANANVEETTAWKNGVFQFQDASIQSIMRQAARWYDVDVSYTGKVDQQFIGKIPRTVNLGTLLKILESTGWVHF